MVALEQLEKDTEAKVQEAQEQADQEQRAIELVKKNTELERCVREMEERFRESEGRQNVEFEDDPSSDSGTDCSGAIYIYDRYHGCNILTNQLAVPHWEYVVV